MQKSPVDGLSYNSLLDGHLAGFYTSPQKRRHLRRMGLITRDGSLVDERTIQRRALIGEYRKKYKIEMRTNAAAVISEEERVQKAELKKKLVTLAKYETVQRVKREKLHPLGIQTYNPPTGHSVRVPGRAATPVQKTKPAGGSLSQSRLSSAVKRHKDKVPFTDNELGELKQLVETIAGARIATTTVLQTKPPPHPLTLSITIPKRNGTTSMNQPKRPSTAPVTSKGVTRKSVGEKSDVQVPPPVKVTLRYLGMTKIMKEKAPLRIVEVYQQARGYTPIPVFKGRIRAMEVLSFDSIRYPEMPYSLVMYIDGMIDCRVSVCCEYRHRQGTRLGGRSARFKVESIQGGSPCNQCQKAREERRKRQRRRLEERNFRPQLSSTLQSTELDTSNQTYTVTEQRDEDTSSLTYISKEGDDEEEDEEISPLSSSSNPASFHSDSQHQNQDENEEAREGIAESPHSLPSSLQSPILSETKEDNQEDTGDGVEANSTGIITEIGSYIEGRKDCKEEDEVPAELVTKGGVRTGTQTDEHFTDDVPTGKSDHRTSSDELGGASENRTLQEEDRLSVGEKTSSRQPEREEEKEEEEEQKKEDKNQVDDEEQVKTTRDFSEPSNRETDSPVMRSASVQESTALPTSHQTTHREASSAPLLTTSNKTEQNKVKDTNRNKGSKKELQKQL